MKAQGIQEHQKVATENVGDIELHSLGRLVFLKGFTPTYLPPHVKTLFHKYNSLILPQILLLNHVLLFSNKQRILIIMVFLYSIQFATLASLSLAIRKRLGYLSFKVFSPFHKLCQKQILEPSLTSYLIITESCPTHL